MPTLQCMNKLPQMMASYQEKWDSDADPNVAPYRPFMSDILDQYMHEAESTLFTYKQFEEARKKWGKYVCMRVRVYVCVCVCPSVRHTF